MGLRLVAHYYDRAEALIAGAALDAAGVPAFIENYHQNYNQPFEEIGRGGFRLMACEQDLPVAVSVLREARAKPLLEGGEFIADGAKITLFLSMLVILFMTATPFPMRRRRWSEEAPKP